MPRWHKSTQALAHYLTRIERAQLVHEESTPRPRAHLSARHLTRAARAPRVARGRASSRGAPRAPSRTRPRGRCCRRPNSSRTFVPVPCPSSSTTIIRGAEALFSRAPQGDRSTAAERQRSEERTVSLDLRTSPASRHRTPTQLARNGEIACRWADALGELCRSWTLRGDCRSPGLSVLAWLARPGSCSITSHRQGLSRRTDRLALGVSTLADWPSTRALVPFCGSGCLRLGAVSGERHALAPMWRRSEVRPMLGGRAWQVQ